MRKNVNSFEKLYEVSTNKKQKCITDFLKLFLNKFLM